MYKYHYDICYFDHLLGILKKMLCTSYLKNWKLDQAAEGRRTCCPTRCCLEYQKLTLALSKFVKLTIFIFIFFIIYFAKISDKYKMPVTVYQPIFNQIFTYIYTDKFLVRCKLVHVTKRICPPYVIGKSISYWYNVYLFHSSFSLDLPSNHDITFAWKHC